MGVREEVAERFPSLMALLNEPEVGGLLTQAVTESWSSAKFQSEFIASNWFRSQTEEGRRRWVQLQTDPTSFWAEAGAYADELSEIMMQLSGRVLSPEERQWLAALGMNSGIAPDSATMRNYLRPLIEGGAVIQGQGAAGVASSEIAGIIRGQWFTYSDTPQDLQHNIALSTRVATGQDTLESINARYATWAQAAYPHLKEQIAAGQTLADIFNPYRQLIAEELEMGSVEQVDMSNPEWRKLLDWRDPTGGARLPTASEVQVLARNRPQWWKTSRGREADAGMARSLLQSFGVRS